MSTEDSHGHGHGHDHDHGDDLTPEQELAIAGEALDQGDLGHAMQHVAGALASGPLAPEAGGLLERILEVADDPLALVPFTHGTSFAIVAVRAYVLAKRGRFSEALELLFQVAAVHPEIPYLAWADEWLKAPGAGASVDPASLANHVGRWVVDLEGDDDAGRSAIVCGLPAVAQLAAAHPQSVDLRYWHVAALRKLSRWDDALATARTLYEEHSTWRSALAVAMVLKMKGDLDDAVDMFQKAIGHRPDDLGCRLDLGDMLCGGQRFDEGLRWYQEVLDRDPEHAWALPSFLFYRWVHLRDAASAKKLRAVAKANPTNGRAAQLVTRLDEDDAPTVRARPKARPPVKAKATAVKPAPAKKKAAPAKKKAAPKKKATSSKTKPPKKKAAPSKKKAAPKKKAKRAKR
ncbi:MAG: tetratricopeptide repeat protein [Polyangiales bacterium]